MITMTQSRTLLGAAALLTGSLLLAIAAQAGNSSVQPTATTVKSATSATTVLSLAPLKCESSGTPSEFPSARITNVSAAPIAHGKTIAYKFSSGKHASFVLKADLPSQGSVLAPEADEAGYTCSAKIL